MIHINIGSNLQSNVGSRFDNITLSVKLLQESKIKIKKISNFFETPSYPNTQLPKVLNIGLLVDFDKDFNQMFQIIKLIEKKLGGLNQK